MHNLVMGFIVGLRYMKNNLFRNWVDEYGKPTALIFEERGKELFGDIVYFIGMEDLSGNEKTMGFFALFNCVLNRLCYADRLGLLPYVSWPKTILYFDNDKDGNVWEYYFQPVSDVRFEEAENAHNFVLSREKDSQFNLKGKSGYELDGEGIINLAGIMKKYICVNATIQEYLQMGLDSLGFQDKQGGGARSTYQGDGF